MILLPLLTMIVAALGAAWLARPGNPLSARALPEARSLHEVPTPSGAGLAVVVALLGADLVIRALLRPGEPAAGLLPHPNLLAALLLLAAISWADDRRPLPPWLRLIVHCGAAALAVRSGLVGGGASGVALALAVLIVWSINLFNFMDGLDGLAGGMAVIGFGALTACGLAAGHDAFALSALCVTAAYAGFLAWNFPPARIFLGDVGSAPLGFLAAAFAAWGWREGVFSAAVPALIFAPFWLDATWTLLRRALRRERVWQAHCTHAYQRLARGGWGHRRTALVEYLWMLACAAAAYWGRDAAPATLLALGAGAGACYVALVLQARRLERARAGRSAAA